MKNKITLNRLRWDCGVFLFSFFTFLFILPSMANNDTTSETSYFIKHGIMWLLIIVNTYNGSVLFGNLLTYIKQKD